MLSRTADMDAPDNKPNQESFAGAKDSAPSKISFKLASSASAINTTEEKDAPPPVPPPPPPVPSAPQDTSSSANSAAAPPPVPPPPQFGATEQQSLSETDGKHTATQSSGQSAPEQSSKPAPKPVFSLSFKKSNSGPAPSTSRSGAPAAKRPKLAAQSKLDATAVFGDDDGSDDEEIPFEARLRMRNVGSQTKGATGPHTSRILFQKIARNHQFNRGETEAAASQTKPSESS